MKLFLKILGALVIAFVILIAGVSMWSSAATKRVYATVHTTHDVDFPVPFPLSSEDAANRGLDDGLADSVALAEAVARGRHLVVARYACIECHGTNLGGGVMVDAFPLGSLLAPNLTGGTGGRTRDYTARDWDRVVRHGVLPDGRPAVMPSEDYRRMSDQELSDIVAYIRSVPPADNTVPASAFGPLGKMLVATGQLVPSAVLIEDHAAPHPVLPPEALPSVEFGRHLAATCTGCHGATLAGGPIKSGDPSWPPARNLTPDPTGLAGWTREDFVAAMQDGVRPDGTPLKEPMAMMTKYGKNMTPVELEALWVYLQSLPPVANAIP